MIQRGCHLEFDLDLQKTKKKRNEKMAMSVFFSVLLSRIWVSFPYKIMKMHQNANDPCCHLSIKESHSPILNLILVEDTPHHALSPHITVGHDVFLGVRSQ